jgi:acetoin utilization deacetylase AcuC-like enzyme
MIVVYDELYRRHLAGIGHPESPDRVAAVARFLEEHGLFAERTAARDASDEELALVHPRAYIDRVRRDVEQVDGRAGYLSTGDTVIDGSSLAVARRAAGGALVAMELAVARNAATFALVRPPGHHAEPTRGMGFCLFGNAAIAAHAFVARTGGTALVVDFDYHHGNGSQAAARGGVSFLSTHAYPQYPGTGGPAENLLRERDAIVNVPLTAHSYGTEAFVATWQRALPDVAARLRPDILIVSAGYDYAAGDPVGDLGVDGPLAARELARTIREVAASFCGGRVAYVLEGGYDIDTLAASVAETVRTHDAPEMRGDRADAGSIPSLQRALLDRVAEWSASGS